MYCNSCPPHNTPLMHCARWNPHKTMKKVYFLYNLIHDKLQVFTSDTCITNTWSREYADVPSCMHLSVYAPFAPGPLAFSLLCVCVCVCVCAASYTSRQLSVTDCQQHTFVILIPLHLTSMELIMHLTCIPSISLSIGALAERTLR